MSNRGVDIIARAKYGAEQAEVKADRSNQFAEQLGVTGHLNGSPTFVLGAKYQQPGKDGPGNIVQAALLVPKGVGLLIYDFDDYRDLEDSGDLGSERDVNWHFQAFKDCSIAEKSFLNEQIDEMQEDLEDLALVAESSANPGKGIPVDEYFSRRAKENRAGGNE
jgi:hypothetical protein